MAKVLPFKAVRPTRDKVSLVASRSYQSYTQAELEARLDYNPFSFLHVVNPGYRYHKTISGKERYNLVKNRYLEFKEEAVFIQDNEPSYYVYKIVNREGNSFSGIIAGTSAEDYELDVIKKHEDTIEFRENIFKDYLKTVGFNAEPVLLTYPDNPIIDSIILETQKERAEFEFTTTYRDTHYLWILNNEKIIEFPRLELKITTKDKSEIDYLCIMTPNSFNNIYKDINILSMKNKINSKNIIINFHEFGNSVSSTIPLAIIIMLEKGEFTNGKYALLGFGVGLAYSGIIINLYNGSI